jgi:hypothetical protein
MHVLSVITFLLSLLAPAAPYHAAERTRQVKRVIPMRVYHDATGALHCAIASPDLEQYMLGLTAEDYPNTARLHIEARANTLRPFIEAGSRVHVPGYMEMEGAHASLYLSSRLGDEIMWTSEGINFEVSVQRDPMLILATARTSVAAIRVGQNVGIENPFSSTFPRTNRGGAVYSGAAQKHATAQRHFVYLLKDLGTGSTFDPDVIVD